MRTVLRTRLHSTYQAANSIAWSSWRAYPRDSNGEGLEAFPGYSSLAVYNGGYLVCWRDLAVCSQLHPRAVSRLLPWDTQLTPHCPQHASGQVGKKKHKADMADGASVIRIQHSGKKGGDMAPEHRSTLLHAELGSLFIVCVREQQHWLHD
jgi:hypothetical protein